MKKQTARSKGIIVMTHKEVSQITLLSAHTKILSGIKQRFLLGVHYGWFQDSIQSPPWVDFHFAPSSTATFGSGAGHVLSYNSSYFTPACFHARSVPKQWDIVSVTRPAPFKKTDELLRMLRMVKTRRPQTRALVICPSSSQSKARSQGDALWAQYARDFSEAERRDVVFLPFRMIGAPFPFPPEDIAFFYNASRLFTLFSAVEGGSKVIKEAMLCGLPVVLRRGLKGGGLDFANEGNSRLFSDEREAADACCEILDEENLLQVDTQSLAQQLSETYTVPRLLKDLQQLFQDLGLEWDGEADTIDLARKLPSHIPGRFSKRGFWTGDLRSPSAVFEYFEAILAEAGVDAPAVGAVERAALSLEGARREGREHYRTLKKQVVSLLGKA